MTNAEAIEVCLRIEKDLSSVLNHVREHRPSALTPARRIKFCTKVQRESDAFLYVLKSIILQP